MDRYLDPKPAGASVALVVGTMNFGKRTPEPESHRIVHRALERGLDFFDTANAYNAGESERILGRALKGRQGRIATKVGFGPDPKNAEGLAPERIAAAIDESLQRLGRETIDLYYFHKPDHAQPLEASLRAMQKLIDNGKVRAFGASNFASWQMVEMAQFGLKPRVSQQMYNLLVRQLEIEYFRFAQKYGVHTTVYNPLAGGLLAGKGNAGARFENNAMYQRRYLTDRFFELSEAFARLAAEAGRSRVELAYQWIAARPGVDSILLGPASVEQLDAAIDAVAKPLPAEVVKKCDELYRAFQGTDAAYAR